MKKLYRYFLFLMFCFLISACNPALVVNSNGDGEDTNVGDGKCETAQGDCTLRAAIMEANHVDDVNKIFFENVSLIEPDSPLPQLTASNTHIDGNGAVILRGINFDGDGLVILDSSYNIIQGLTIKDFNRAIYIRANSGNARYNKIGLLAGNLGDSNKRNFLDNNINGVVIHGQGASDNVVSGNKIGSNASAANTGSGIVISGGAHDNLIGGLTDIATNQGGNLIGVNSAGIFLHNAHNNQISGNFIGIWWNNSMDFGNANDGIRMLGSDYNVIGIAPDGSGFMNVISGNETEGMWIENSDHNIIAGNYIGTNFSGTTAAPNRNGIYLANGSSRNIIGTNGDGVNDSGEGNLISGNNYNGVNISGTTTIKNVIAGNYIGTTKDGSSPLGNSLGGVSSSGDMNLIGTNGDGLSDALEANIISGNGGSGVLLDAFHNIVAGNYIGTDPTGMIAVPNGEYGVSIGPDGKENIIGTDGDGVGDYGERNIISGNSAHGVFITGDENIISGNFIGADMTGSAILANMGDGIQIAMGGSKNLIGTDGDETGDTNEMNLISGNGQAGIWILDGHQNRVAGNRIGSDLNGASAIPNGHTSTIGFLGAVLLSNGSTGNIIGTNSDGSGDSAEGNLISGNTTRGVVIHNDLTNNNIIAGNLIGTDITGGATLGNDLGVEIGWNAEYNLIGTNGDGNADILERNIISGNANQGILLSGSNNEIAGNFIGTDYFGTGDLGNGSHGIATDHKATENTIGGSLLKANIIAFNGSDGILVSSQQLDSTLITYNSIHSNDGLGIDLSIGSGDGVTANDGGDLDTGPNDLLNFPILDIAVTNNATTTVTGEIIEGLSSTQFEIQFFSSDTCDPSGYGEGKTFIGAINVGTDSLGYASFLANLNPGASTGQFITTTATKDGRTSEFSQCVEVTESTNYNLELEDPICQEFDSEQMKLVIFPVKSEDLIFNLYVKNTFDYPGADGEASDDGEHGYYAVLGENKALNCNFQGFADRLYCSFLVGEDDINTTKELLVFFELCGSPILTHPSVSILPYTPPTEEPSCYREMSRAECNEAGGIFRAEGYCDCP